MNLILLLLLIVILLGVVPVWPHSAKWGYGPSGLLVVVLLVVLLLYMF
jgi:hypothetical protein